MNEAGLAFYDRLVDALLESGIQPCVTLYHWDLPQPLEDSGGWPSRGTVDAFAEYVEVVASRLGDRVRHWITHNEPWVVAWLGYGWGVHAPGRATEPDALATAHHLLLSHGRAVEVLRREAPGAEVGITLNLMHDYPASDTEEDVAATRHIDGVRNRWFLDPLYRAEYPRGHPRALPRPACPRIEDGDMEAIAVPIDVLGINMYSRGVIGAGPDGGRPIFVRMPDSEYTDMDWEVYPDGLYDLLLRLRDDYAPARIAVTENGAAFSDVRGHDGRVRDPERQAYLEGHIDAVARAVEDGVPVSGYYVWSLLDNFEWAHGYAKRFGIVYVDYPTLERVPKGSFEWYRDFIARQRKAAAAAAAATA